jgi:hypothetical protein
MSQTLGDPFATPPFATNFGAGTTSGNTESLSGTVITTVGPIIRNSALDAFTLTGAVGSYQIAVNGVVHKVTSSVTLLLYWNHTVWQENSANNWYYEKLASGPWIGPTTDPRLPTITHAILQTRIDAAVALLNSVRADLAALSP